MKSLGKVYHNQFEKFMFLHRWRFALRLWTSMTKNKENITIDKMTLAILIKFNTDAYLGPCKLLWWSLWKKLKVFSRKRALQKRSSKDVSQGSKYASTVSWYQEGGNFNSTIMTNSGSIYLQLKTASKNSECSITRLK